MNFGSRDVGDRQLDSIIHWSKYRASAATNLWALKKKSR